MPLSTTQGQAPRQSHADAALWYPFSDYTGSFENRGAGGSADLIITGTALNQVAGPLGKAAYLYADAGFAGAVSKTLETSCSIWAWIVPDKQGLIWGRYRTTDGEKRLTLEISSDKCLATAHGSTTVTVTSDRPVVTGTPNLLALTYDPEDSSLLTVYVNGIPSGSVECNGVIHWSDESPVVVWGGGLSAHTDECPGIYAELGGDSRAYDGTEFAEMYRRGMGWR